MPSKGKRLAWKTCGVSILFGTTIQAFMSPSQLVSPQSFFFFYFSGEKIIVQSPLELELATKRTKYYKLAINQTTPEKNNNKFEAQAQIFFFIFFFVCAFGKGKFLKFFDLDVLCRISHFSNRLKPMGWASTSSQRGQVD
jgi:hypothetical protein